MTTVAATAGLNWSSKFGVARVPPLAEWAVQNAPLGLKGGEVIEREGLRVVPRKFRRKKLLEAMVSVVGAATPLDDCDCHPENPGKEKGNG
jgi:hypothetical protein